MKKTHDFQINQQRGNTGSLMLGKSIHRFNWFGSLAYATQCVNVWLKS
ncbi:MAG: hypothetical protein NWQ54_04600 [Paraglaciecola sp.]|nr:hypothetical protein [Paraglaciecola sp.]MDP5030853.1 hypothetical protein [Paraglaciecola sp.]MDP5130137.1 hypothetical protein [Paraglaciecola sp.]